MGMKLEPLIKATGTPMVPRIREAFKASMKTVIEEKRAVIDARLLIPSRRTSEVLGLTVAKRTIELTKIGFTGKVERTMTRGKDLPRAVYSKETILRKLLFLGMEIEIDRDMRDQIEDSIIMPTDLTTPVVKLILEDENELLMKGDEVIGLQGLSNLEGRRVYSVTKTWVDASGKEIYDNVVMAAKEFGKDAQFKVITIAVHPDLWYELETKRVLETVETTVLVELQKEYNIIKSFSLVDDTGAAGVVILDNRPENYFFIEIMAPNNTATYNEKGNDVQIFEEKLSEVIAPYPKAVMFIEGVI